MELVRTYPNESCVCAAPLEILMTLAVFASPLPSIPSATTVLASNRPRNAVVTKNRLETFVMASAPHCSGVCMSNNCFPYAASA